MFGLGTIINTLAIVFGGVTGMLFGNKLSDKHQKSLQGVCGIAVLFIGIAGTMEKMIHVEEGLLISEGTLQIVLALTIGTLIGEFFNIEDKFEKFGEWLKRKSNSVSDVRFVDGFVDATLTVCIGAMAIVGAINDGIYGDSSILITKAILDFVIIMVMAASMGKGTIFSCIPVFLFQGSITVLAKIVEPLLTLAALNQISLIGSILIFCVGLNLVWGKKVSVANMLPALIIGIIFTYINL